jgi:adenosylcobinamide-GDP ribazoletransferase
MTAFLEAVRFLSILPVPFAGTPSESSVARSVVYFPLVGGLLGAILALTDRGTRFLGTGLLPAAIVLVVWIGLTGGLHLDGLADTADGLLGGLTPERRLGIMKDSRLGTFGALALFMALTLKLALLAQSNTVWRSSSLVLAPVLARWAMVLAVTQYSSARKQGLGHLFREQAGVQHLVLASTTALALSLLCAGLWGLTILVGVWLIGLWFNHTVMSSIGGLTGDTYGALCEVEEICVLFMTVMLGGRQLWWS